MKAPEDLRFLVTAGPTREFLDPIRYLSNRSSGKMGYALAAAAHAISSHVTLVSGPTALPHPGNVDFFAVTSAREMADAVLARYPGSDVVVMAAAVCDFQPRKMAGAKIKKGTFAGVLELEPTPDILAELGRRKESQVLVGFAAETDHVEENAADKLRRKRLDMIVANSAAAFDAETNQVTLLFADGRREALPEMPKPVVAAEIIKRAIALCR